MWAGFHSFSPTYLTDSFNHTAEVPPKDMGGTSAISYCPVPLAGLVLLTATRQALCEAEPRKGPFNERESSPHMAHPHST
jgi:hypothetical protein